MMCDEEPEDIHNLVKNLLSCRRGCGYSEERFWLGKSLFLFMMSPEHNTARPVSLVNPFFPTRYLWWRDWLRRRPHHEPSTELTVCWIMLVLMLRWKFDTFQCSHSTVHPIPQFMINNHFHFKLLMTFRYLFTFHIPSSAQADRPWALILWLLDLQCCF